MSVIEDLQTRCLHILASEINFYSLVGKMHLTFHLSNFFVRLNLKVSCLPQQMVVLYFTIFLKDQLFKFCNNSGKWYTDSYKIDWIYGQQFLQYIIQKNSTCTMHILVFILYDIVRIYGILLKEQYFTATTLQALLCYARLWI